MFLTTESILNDKNIPMKMLRSNLHFLSENKDFSKSTREQILGYRTLSERETFVRIFYKILPNLVET